MFDKESILKGKLFIGNIAKKNGGYEKSLAACLMSLSNLSIAFAEICHETNNEDYFNRIMSDAVIGLSINDASEFNRIFKGKR